MSETTWPSAGELAAKMYARRADWLPRYFPHGAIGKGEQKGVFFLGSADGDAGRSLPIPLRAKPVVTDFAGGFSGDDLDLLGRAIGGDSKATYREAMAYLGITIAKATEPQKSRPPPKAAPEPDRAVALRAAMRLWQAALPIEPDNLAGRYLTARGCALPHPDGDLRWAPKVHHSWSGHTGPALLALVTDPVTVEPVTLHRTWLAADGSGKAAVSPARAAWHGLPLGGGVCRLWPDDEVALGLGLGEGLETTLAMALGFTPVWASLNAGNMEVMPALAGIDCLTLAVDWDRVKQGRSAGMDAAVACGRRWLAAGCQVRIWPPNGEGRDLADRAKAILAEIQQETLAP